MKRPSGLRFNTLIILYGYLYSCLPPLKGEIDEPFMNDLLPVNASEGNINILNISNCQATKG